MIFESNTEYDGITLSGFDEEKSSYSFVQLTECTVEDGRLFESEITDSIFEDVVFNNVDFSLTKFTNSSFVNCTFNNCKLLGVDWTLVTSDLGLQLKGDRTDFRYAIFQGIDMKFSSFTDCNFEEADFTEASLVETEFKDCNFLKAIFMKTNFNKSNFSGSTNIAFIISENKVEGLQIDSNIALDLVKVQGIKIN